MGRPIKLKLKQPNLLIYLILSLMLCNVSANSAIILQYHHVSEDTPAITSLSPKQFKQHMDYLNQHNFNVVPLEQLINAIVNKTPIADKTVAITFDDGYDNVYDNARPILKQFDWPYTVFVNSDFVDQKYSRHMSWDQLRTIAKEKATIANHTRKHDYLLHKPENLTDKQWQQQIAADIQHVEQRITTEIGQQHKLVAYPYGEFDQHTQATLKSLGFIGIGQHSGAVGHYTDLTRVPRFPASGIYANLDKLKIKINSLAMPILSLEQADPVVRQNPPTVILSVKLDDIHTKQIQCFNSGPGKAIIKWLDDKRFSVTATKPLNTGRSRYNCTAPSKQKPGRFYWFSQPWVKND